MRSWLIAAFVVGCLAGAAETPPGGATSPRFPLLPVDEATHDNSLLKFRAELIAAVKRRDVEGVMRNVDANVDRSRDKDALRGRLSWNGGDNPSWAHLESALALGGSFTTTRGRVEQRREFCAPYTYSTYPWPVPLQFTDEL